MIKWLKSFFIRDPWQVDPEYKKMKSKIEDVLNAYDSSGPVVQGIVRNMVQIVLDKSVDEQTRSSAIGVITEALAKTDYS